ncbi:MAG: alpha-L-fucosidase [Candidatus Aminicenantes bacterium]|nr:alpha-L-fucosidase [Candidatus Aminicenantes bacterium]
MKKLFIVICLLAGFFGCLFSNGIPVTFSSIKDIHKAREQRISWWREAKFGMMITWGLYSIPAGVWKNRAHPDNYAEWIMFDEKSPVQEYARLADGFNPVRFDARSWATIAKMAGMKYIVFMAKHHDGFSMFKSDLTDFDIVDATPFKRDVTDELAQACREAGLKFGCYYSVDRDWHRPQGPGNEYKQTNTWDFPKSTRPDFDKYFRDFAKPQVEELLLNYKPDILWFDGIGMKSDQQLQELVSLIRKLRPECLINSRIKTCKIPLIDPSSYCDYVSVGDNEIPNSPPGFDWETAGTMNSTYGYSRIDTNWLETKEIIFRLVDIVSKGGNYLLNIGPTSEGTFPEPCVERLMEVGKWMEINGEAIYGTKVWQVCGEGPRYEKEATKDYIKETKGEETINPDVDRHGLDIRFTAKGNMIYAICLGWPKSELLVKSLGKKAMPNIEIIAVSILGSKEEVRWQRDDEGLILSSPEEKPCEYAFVYKIYLKGR